MIYVLNDKKIRIPDNIIQACIKNLQVTEQEAIQMYLEDEGYFDNVEQNELDKKAKDNRITATIHEAKALCARPKTQKERVQKEDKEKENLISNLAAFLTTLNYTDVEIVNKTKLITFKIGEDCFKLDLIRQRKPK